MHMYLYQGKYDQVRRREHEHYHVYGGDRPASEGGDCEPEEADEGELCQPGDEVAERGDGVAGLPMAHTLCIEAVQYSVTKYVLASIIKVNIRLLKSVLLKMSRFVPGCNLERTPPALPSY